jgi:hypothetical protein
MMGLDGRFGRIVACPEAIDESSFSGATGIEGGKRSDLAQSRSFRRDPAGAKARFIFYYLRHD